MGQKPSNVEQAEKKVSQTFYCIIKSQVNKCSKNKQRIIKTVKVVERLIKKLLPLN